MLGARLASALIHGSTGLNTSNNLMQNALMLLQLAIGQDNQQGADSIQDNAIPEFISARF